MVKLSKQEIQLLTTVEIEFSTKYMGIIYFKEKEEGEKIYSKIIKNMQKMLIKSMLKEENIPDEKEFINDIEILNLLGSVGI
ncbi:MAG: hypothetical protein J7K83_03750 [Candidatus Aenigmarchaeota archaeon]|nr:hypothetical protein [Candidatus Aenigmarchaeota archaeon]